jgi:hypothetical protein
MWVGGERDGGGDKEKMSVKSDFSLADETDPHAKSNGLRSRKASLSLPGSPFNFRRGSRGTHHNHNNYKHGRKGVDKKPVVLSTYMDAQEHLPYADDSTAATPLSEENGTILVPNYGTDTPLYYIYKLRLRLLYQLLVCSFNSTKYINHDSQNVISEPKLDALSNSTEII